MKFKFNQDVDPKELIGMEPSELKTKLDNAVSKEDLTGLETKLTETIKESLKNIQVQSTPTPTPTPTRNAEEPISFIEDENAAFNQRARPLAIATLQTQAEMLRWTVLKDKPYYKAFEKEIDELLRAQPIQFQANRDSVENVYNTVLGKHVEDISTGKVKPTGAVVESATNAGGNNATTRKEGEMFTEAELAAAAGFGIDPKRAMARLGIDEKKYKEIKDKMVISV